MKWLFGIVIAFFAVGLFIGLSRREASDPEAVRLLKAAAQAPQNHDYTARATTYASYGTEPIHSEAVVYNAQGGHTRIEYRQGTLAGVITGRTDKGVEWRFDPLNRNMVAGKRPPPDPSTDRNLDLLLENYRAKMKNHTTIAGRPATEVLLKPRNGGGSRSLWIDNETGVILRSEERNVDNELVAATQYTDIKYGETATPDRFLPIPPGSEPVRWHPQEDFAKEATAQEIQSTLKIPLVQPSYLPAGFMLEGHYIYRCPVCETRAAMTRYINGLDSLTVVQSSDDCDQHQAKQKLNFGLGKAVFVERGSGCFWVMGELPQGDLEKVSQSLPPPPNP